MIQSALIFGFGFVTAALLAFVVAPAIWRRAVYLTRKRIDSSLPLTINELKAEKDVLRAEHAMEVRRIEMRLDKLQENDSVQKAEIAERKQRIKALEGELSTSVAHGKDLDRQIEELSDKLDDRTTELSETSISLESTRTELSVRTDELHAVARQLETVTGRLEDANSDIDYKDGQIEMLSNSVSELKGIRKENQKTIRELQSELSLASEALAQERSRTASLEEKVETAIGRNSDLEVRVERREKEIERLREQLQVADAELREMEDRAGAALEDRRALEVEVGELTARMNGLISILEGREPEDAVEAFKAEIADQASAISGLTAERETLADHLEEQTRAASAADAERYALKAEIAELQGRFERLAAQFDGQEPEAGIEMLRAEQGRQGDELAKLAAERDALKTELTELRAGPPPASGDEVLREKMNQLAAEVVAMAAKLEGPQSRINALLAETGNANTPVSDIVSLADRIKALQRRAEATETA